MRAHTRSSVEQLEEAETVLTLRRRLGSMRRGKKGRPLADVLRELGTKKTRPGTTMNSLVRDRVVVVPERRPR